MFRDAPPLTTEEEAENEMLRNSEIAHTERLLASEDADPNFCDVRDGGYGRNYQSWCRKHDSDPEHISVSGRLVCGVYVSTEPGCDPVECCPRNVE